MPISRWSTSPTRRRWTSCSTCRRRRRDRSARPTRPTRTLRIGESVFGRIVTGVNPKAVTVPVEALVPEGDGFRVFVVDSAGVAHARAVTVGGRSETLAEILTGVIAGETVITTGAYGVEDGVKIDLKGARR